MEHSNQQGLVQRGIDWSTRDVLVGVLRNFHQLEVCINYRFYHIPAKLLTCSPNRVHYVALYQSKRHFGDPGSGVRLYGAVSSYTMVKRGEITEIPRLRGLDELYCRFEIDTWRQLDRSIRVGGLAPGVCMFTNLFLLHNSRYFPELYLRSEAELNLYTTLRRAAARTTRSGGSEVLPSQSDNTVMIMGNTIGVYTLEGSYEEHDLRGFLRQPHSFVKRMGDLMGYEIP